MKNVKVINISKKKEIKKIKNCIIIIGDEAKMNKKSIQKEKIEHILKNHPSNS